MLCEMQQSDIEFGLPNYCTQCPIALMLHRLTGQEWYVMERSVVPTVRLWDVTYPRLPLPPVAIDFVLAFDAKKPVVPIAFELDILIQTEETK